MNSKIMVIETEQCYNLRYRSMMHFLNSASHADYLQASS